VSHIVVDCITGLDELVKFIGNAIYSSNCIASSPQYGNVDVVYLNSLIVSHCLNACISDVLSGYFQQPGEDEDFLFKILGAGTCYIAQQFLSESAGTYP
jgi:hypothetical protein